jgi:hypothetical protein
LRVINSVFILNMLKGGIFISVLLTSVFCRAQYDPDISRQVHHYNLKLTYNSSLIYPGLSAGIEYEVLQSGIWAYKKRNKDKFYGKGRFISGNINWYHHSEFHDNLYLTVEWVMRRTKENGFISEFIAGPGLSRTFLGGTTYKVNDSGDISIEKLAGYYYGLVTIGAGFGFDLSVKEKLPISAIVRMNLIVMFPYNSTIYVRPLLEIGIRYMPWYAKKQTD